MLPTEHNSASHPPAALASTLSGNLPCSRCGYLLEGLSVRDVCPECGLPIATTILAAVDPFAQELQPITRPRLAAGAILLWSAAALGAAVWVWADRAADGVVAAGGSRPWQLSPLLVVILAGLSGLGSLVFIRPASRWPKRAQALAALASFGYLPLLAVLWFIHGRLDAVDTPYFGPGIDAQRHGLRLAGLAIMAGILLGLRPAARQLVARSLRLRQGRVDRQTILAMLACIGVAAAGDVAMLTARAAPGLAGDMLRVGGMALIGIGSLLMTLGLAGMLVDAVRIARAVVSPAPSLRGVLAPEQVAARPEPGSAGVAADG